VISNTLVRVIVETRPTLFGGLAPSGEARLFPVRLAPEIMQLVESRWQVRRGRPGPVG